MFITFLFGILIGMLILFGFILVISTCNKFKNTRMQVTPGYTAVSTNDKGVIASLLPSYDDSWN